MNLNYLMNHILYQIFKNILSILKKHGEKTEYRPARIYTNKIKNRIMFKTKAEYYLELLTPDN